MATDARLSIESGGAISVRISRKNIPQARPPLVLNPTQFTLIGGRNNWRCRAGFSQRNGTKCRKRPSRGIDCVSVGLESVIEVQFLDKESAFSHVKQGSIPTKFRPDNLGNRIDPVVTIKTGRS